MRSRSVGSWSFLWKRHTDIYKTWSLDKVRHICYNVCMIKGCVGFSRIGNSLITKMLLVRGKRVVEVPLIWPLSTIMIKVWNSKNILRKIFYKNSTEFDQLKKSFNL